MVESTASPSSASPSPTPTPTPTPALTPTPTPTGAPTSTFPPGSLEDQLYKATVNFYAAINQSYRTLDTEPVADHLVPGSNAASSYTSYVEKVRSQGHHFEGLGEYQVTNFRVKLDGSNGNTRRVEFTLSISGGREVDANGKAVETYEAETWRDAWITFTGKDGQWLIVGQAVGESSN
ncbi:hypothetical protein [Actinopolymorpha pittospori]|uniref:Uncharacterized protein n=1 Tax=Actinopolymorpha pittospori TaxID=648752 RepID=A0A927N169_9ACTN|nr:hypothetical protein [Actinopolymorpha pittospori]MBE1610745.1 hypothetical protein [Actinopolymorpha pittospori]